MLKAVPYDDRRALVSGFAKDDGTLDWARIFAVAQAETDEEVRHALSSDEVQEVTVAQNPEVIEYVGIGVGIVVLFYMALEIINAVVVGAIIIGAILAVSAMAFFGRTAFLKLVRRRAKQMAERLPGTKDVKLILPAPVTYHLSSSLGTEGEVMAVISRRAPVIEGHEIHSHSHAVGTVVISHDEGASVAAERFEALLSELGALEEKADGPYQKELVRHGLDEQHLLDAEADLRLRVEGAQERRLLNSGVVASLNAQDSSLRAASPEIDFYEGELALDAAVCEA